MAEVLAAIEGCDDSRLRDKCLRACAVVSRALDLYGWGARARLRSCI